jgi:hypothetical protein
LFAFRRLVLSLSRLAEKALAEDEANALLQRRVAELEAANTRMQSELDSSDYTVAALCGLNWTRKMKNANA